MKVKAIHTPTMPLAVAVMNRHAPRRRERELRMSGIATSGDVAILAAVIAGVLTVTNMTYGLMAAQARRFLKSRRAMRNMNRTAGAMMVGAGAVVATS